jgi:hypothetical protein
MFKFRAWGAGDDGEEEAHCVNFWLAVPAVKAGSPSILELGREVAIREHKLVPPILINVTRGPELFHE